MSAATGLEEDLWRVLPGEELTITAVDATITSQTPEGYCAYTEALLNSTITYTYQVTSDGFMCIELDFPKRNSVDIWKNGERVYSETMTLPQMMAVGDVQVGDVVEIKATCKNANETGSLDISAAILNNERFAKCYEILSSSVLELTEFSTTRVEGTINCDRDGLLYTSVPQNGNWKVYVDGEETEVTLIGDVMVGVKLTQGAHEVQLRYHNAAFAWGWKISLVCAAILAVLVYRDKYGSLPVGKYQKKKEKR
jgi:uncharacterized membrane protein YfhO